MSEKKPVLNVVSTIKTEKSAQLQWQINNFGVFLSSTAASLYQKFGPLLDNNVKFELHLSKRQSPQNNDDKLELSLKNINLPDGEPKTTAQLKGQICIKDEEWSTNFVLDFGTTKTHLFATPLSSFNSKSILIFDNMFYEQVYVETDVLNSWIMRFDDPSIMSNSTVDLANFEPISPLEEEFQSLCFEQSSSTSISPNDELGSIFDFYEAQDALRSPSTVSDIENNEVSQESECMFYREKFQDDDEEFLELLDDLINNQANQDDDVEKLVISYDKLYAKLRGLFDSFSTDVPTNKTSFKPEKAKFVKLHVFVAYLMRMLNKLAPYQHVSLRYDMKDYSQERSWFETYNISGQNFPFNLVREIRSYCKQLKDYKLIEACVAKLWTEFTNENVDNEIKLQWTKHIESKIDVLYKQIDNLIIESSKLLIRPMEVKELNDLKIKLAEQQIKIGEALKHDSEVFVQKKKNEIDLNELRRLLNDANTKLVMFPEFETSSSDRIRFIKGTKRRLEASKKLIKSLDQRIAEPHDCLELDNMKDLYDRLYDKLARVEYSVKKESKSEAFNKAVESIRKLHSNFSYTMRTADSGTLMNYEVELCKCLAELETSLQILRDNDSENDTTRIHYKDAKVKTDWIANQLRERLEPWRQFTDLYSNIEASHTSINEIICQLNSKGNTTHHEACKDIEILEAVNLAFENTRKDMAFVRSLCSSGHMKSTGLAVEATQKLKKINNSHKLVDIQIKQLMFKLKNPFSRFQHYNRRGHHRQGGSSYDSFY